MLDNIVYLKKYCNKCNTEVEMRNGAYYCNKCEKYVPFYIMPNINYDERMWSTQELKDLIIEVVKEMEK